MRATHTFATLTVSHDAHYEIAEALKSAGYDHAFQPDPDVPGAELIDMHGIALRDTVESAPASKTIEISIPLAIKLGSMIVHADESMSVGGHPLDESTFQSLKADPEVRSFLYGLAKDQFLPLRRDGVQYGKP